ncbi:2-C-methyl-D-erythritol 4-phosphate cytidylyltransferase [Vibrio cyclitrophicus]|uniref:2-C-methyl-D-erythritol 4-phosphate cytidylyltransferase n=1 Tax=Vibrio cyclitrophicus TaxID=47951 RepID=UPI0038B4D8C7
MSKYTNIAVILAGGVGSRFGGDLPKQFVKLSGKTVFEHTLAAFENHHLIDEVIIVCKAEYINKVENIVNLQATSKVTHIVCGGKERADSTQSALACIKGKHEGSKVKLLIHDSVRPFISDEIITQCIIDLDANESVDVAVPCTDTIIKVKDGCIADIPKRSELYQGQTPQGFHLTTLLKAYELMDQDPDFLVTDDCGVVKHFLPDVDIKVVSGDYNNIKITNPNDIQVADILFQLNQKDIASTDVDLSKFDKKVVVVFGGSYGIGKSIIEKLDGSGALIYSFSRTETGASITDSSAIERFLADIYEKHQRIDAVINTTGSLNKKPLAQTTEEEIREDIDVNLISNFNLARIAFKYLKETGGNLILFSSSSYTRGRAFYSVYSSTKAAIVNLTQALSEEWAPHGVRINCITPDRTKTPMREKNFGLECEKTLLTPEEVADVTLIALSNDVTGVNFRCQL